MTRNVEVIPSARRLVRSLRDLGYDCVQAVADLIDNSIAAGASEVRTDVSFAGSQSWISISDNGQGMSRASIPEAMRFGSEREYSPQDLGKFGLGLKTASLSQCRRLAVFSRVSQSRADIAGFCWDLDHIERTNRWEIMPLGTHEVEPRILEPLRQSSCGKAGSVCIPTVPSSYLRFSSL